MVCNTTRTGRSYPGADHRQRLAQTFASNASTGGLLAIRYICITVAREVVVANKTAPMQSRRCHRGFFLTPPKPLQLGNNMLLSSQRHRVTGLLLSVQLKELWSLTRTGVHVFPSAAVPAQPNLTHASLLLEVIIVSSLSEGIATANYLIRRHQLLPRF